MHVVERGPGIIGFHQFTGGGEILQGTQEAGDAHDIGRLGTGGFDGAFQTIERLRGERRDGVERIVAGGDGGGQEDQAMRAHLLFPGGNGLQDHLRAFERQAAGSDQAERGQRLPAVGEDFADQVAHAAQVAGAGDEGANFEHGVAAGFAGEGFEGVAHLGGKQTAGGEGVTWKVRRRVSPMTAPGSSLGSCRVWVISSFLGLGFFCAASPGARTRQQADASSANLLMVLLRVRVAVNGAWAWAGIMGWLSAQRRLGRFRRG